MNDIEEWGRVTCETCKVTIPFKESKKLGWSKRPHVHNNGEKTFIYRCTRCESPKTPRPVHPFKVDPELEKTLESAVRCNAEKYSNRWKEYVDSMETENYWMTVLKACGLGKPLSAYWHSLSKLDGKTPIPDDTTRAVFQRVEKELFGKTVEED